MAAQEEAGNLPGRVVSRGRAWIRRTVISVAVVALIWGVVAWITWPDVSRLAEHNPETTAFIDRYRQLERAAGRSDRVDQRWVAYDHISPEVKRAVVSGEDLEFFFHHGFSEREMWAAFREAAEGGRKRGASTITQQLAKNLWLSQSKSPLRKVKEALLTWQLEHDLSKSRILELYLNVAEFGQGIYGVGAAARHYFNKSASDLDAHEAAQLAASLPRPSDWHPGVPSQYYAAYVTEIERRVNRAAFLAKYVGGPVAARAESIAVPDSALKALLDSIAKQAKSDTIRGDTVLVRDSMHRDTVKHDTLP